MVHDVDNSGGKKATRGRPKKDAGLRGQAAGSAAELWQKFWQQAFPLVEEKVGFEVKNWLKGTEESLGRHQKALLAVEEFQNTVVKPHFDTLARKVAFIDRIQDQSIEEVDSLIVRVDDLEKEIGEIDRQLNSPRDTSLEEDLKKRVDHVYADIQDRIQALQNEVARQSESFDRRTSGNYQALLNEIRNKQHSLQSEIEERVRRKLQEGLGAHIEDAKGRANHAQLRVADLDCLVGNLIQRITMIERNRTAVDLELEETKKKLIDLRLRTSNELDDEKKKVKLLQSENSLLRDELKRLGWTFST